MMPSFKVLSYTREHLADALSNEFIAPEDLLRVGQMILPDESIAPATEVSSEAEPLLQGGNLYNFPYLLTYLGKGGLHAKTILVEEQFTSRDYLLDYASYYATCKQAYSKVCKRVHFFNTVLTEAQMSHWLFAGAHGSSPEVDPVAAYLGYVVVKPIPFSFMGTTLLRPYPAGQDTSRNMSVTKHYRVNLFGRELGVQSLAFQSQDKATSACASSALWSAFHKTSATFQTPCPSPSEITSFSGNLYSTRGRTFPNTGLDYNQVGKAIEHVGLVSEMRTDLRGWSHQITKGFIYGYLRMGLPVLLGIHIVDAERHLVTLTGYRREKLPVSRGKGLDLVSDGIQKFYVHDDQLGPFSRISIENTTEAYSCNTKITTGWPDKGSFQTPKTAEIKSLVVPMHPFIRISYEEIYELARRLDALLDEVAQGNVWDIFLDDSSRMKSELSALPPPPDQLFNEAYLRSILLLALPRYVWRAQCYCQGRLVMELLLDATDVPRGQYLSAVIFHHPGFQGGLCGALEDTAGHFSQKIIKVLGRRFYGTLLHHAQIPMFSPSEVTTT